MRTTRLAMLQPLRRRDFSRPWAGQTVSMLGNGLGSGMLQLVRSARSRE